MVNVGHSCHDSKRDIMENPTDDGIQTGVMDVVDVGLVEFTITSLPAHEVPED